jgi:hypothetical protein
MKEYNIMLKTMKIYNKTSLDLKKLLELIERINKDYCYISWSSLWILEKKDFENNFGSETIDFYNENIKDGNKILNINEVKIKDSVISFEEIMSFFNPTEEKDKYNSILRSSDNVYLNFALTKLNYNGSLLKVSGFDELTKENFIKNLEIFQKTFALKKDYKDYFSSNELKGFKDLMFLKVDPKKWNTIIKELEDEGVLIVSRTPFNIIKDIKINTIKQEDLTSNYEIYLKLKSNGKLKEVQRSHIIYKNDKLLPKERTHELELYKLHLLSHLKTNIIYDKDEWFLEIDYFALKYAKDIMQDLKGGTWTIFKNNLNETIKDKMEILEEYLELEIERDIFPLKYKTNENGATLFRSKPLKLKYKMEKYLFISMCEK